MGLVERFLRLLRVILGFGSRGVILLSQDFIEPVVLVVASEDVAMVEG